MELVGLSSMHWVRRKPCNHKYGVIAGPSGIKKKAATHWCLGGRGSVAVLKFDRGISVPLSAMPGT
jgi:hypothetical protein